MVSGAAAPLTFNPPARVRYLIRGLASEETREQSLDVLCKNRLAYDNLAVLLWHSFGIMGVLLKIITSAYRPLLSDGLTENAVTQVCNAIALFQCVASHPDTRIPFIRATMPVYLYPFLNTMSNERSYECLRITSLGVIGSLAKVEDPEVIEYLLSTQIFPSCLRCMEVGKTLSRTVSTFIIYRILLSEKGLKYCFVLAERYLSVSQCLGKLVENLSEDDAENLPHLLKNIIGCYLRLSENERTRPQLSSYIPWKLLDGKYANIVRSDPMALADLRQLVCNLRTSKSCTTHCTDEPPASSDSPGTSIP
ncbi:cell differentiation protein rcd1 isoform X2 [Gossypium raimondii]|uniref:Cell differentiation protein rcd1 n=1 Tax=Gossypium raimondii TaxID=29730 RepID=A0A0D2Q2E5_GOSRA|nr:cell differentiation protein rcd1 isoform X2 [Gossypium raimondii]KJB10671.1 hypothetical protein B456_001G215400 [Gossypium raimondii]